MLPFEFWREFAQIESVIAIKIAPFHRYATQDVLRGVAASGRAKEITLYTGNDDHIVLDLLSTFVFEGEQLQMRGGLLGHWAAWTKPAVEMHRAIRTLVESNAPIEPEWMIRNGEVTDMNAALFDVCQCISWLYRGHPRGVTQARSDGRPMVSRSEGRAFIGSDGGTRSCHASVSAPGR